MEQRLMNYDVPGLSVSRIVTTGCGNNVSFMLHSHNFYEIFLLKSDSAVFYVDGTIYHLQKDDVMIFNSTELHNISFDNSKPYDRFVIHFMPTLLLAFDNDKYNLLNMFNSRKSGRDNYISKEMLKKTEFFEIMEKTERIIQKNPPYIDAYFLALFVELLIALNEAKGFAADGNYPRLSNEKIRNILAYIDDNLTENLSLDRLSDEFFMSKSNMCHLFKETTGFPIKQYITYRRIALARKLMANGYGTLEASVAAGFNDYSNFYKTFKKVMNKSPKEFK